MSSRASGSRLHRLPSRFPVGTRYVIEGSGGHIHLRYLEFPDGRQVALPLDAPARRGAAARTGRAPASRSNTPKKYLNGTGTVRRLGG